MRCNGCQQNAPMDGEEAEIVALGWRIERIPATSKDAHPDTPRSPASKLVYCPPCVKRLRLDEAEPGGS